MATCSLLRGVARVGPGVRSAKVFLTKGSRRRFALEGTVRFEVEGETADVQAADMHASHLVWSTDPSNPTDEPCRFLGLAVAGRLESYFDELSEMRPASFLASG